MFSQPDNTQTDIEICRKPMRVTTVCCNMACSSCFLPVDHEYQRYFDHCGNVLELNRGFGDDGCLPKISASQGTTQIRFGDEDNARTENYCR